jgi:hypothetical protein
MVVGFGLAARGLMAAPVPLRSAFFVVSILLATGFFLKEYAEIAVDAIHRLPRAMCFVYFVAAYVLVYVVRKHPPSRETCLALPCPALP